MFLKIIAQCLVLFRYWYLLLKVSDAWNVISRTLDGGVKWNAYQSFFSHVLRVIAVTNFFFSSTRSTITFFTFGIQQLRLQEGYLISIKKRSCYAIHFPCNCPIYIRVMKCRTTDSQLKSTIRTNCCIYTGLFISPFGISELDYATTKTDTAERSISRGRASLQVFFCTRGLGVLPGSTARG